MTIEITGTGGIIEGNLGAADVNVNLDPVYGNFNGTTSSSLTNDNDFDLIWDANGGLVSVWIYADSAGESDYPRIFDKNQWIINLRDYDSATNSAKLNFSHNFDGGGADWRTTDRLIKFDAWNHIAVAYDADATGNDPYIYINGAYVGAVGSGLTEGNTPVGTRVSDASSSLVIGNNSSGTRTFHGYIMDVKIYKNVAVSATNVGVLASKINVDPDVIGLSGLQGWFKFNADTTTDSSGNSNNLTASNMGSVVYDAFSVDVYDNSTTTDGTFTVTQGKVEGKALTSLAFDGTNDNVILASSIELEDFDYTIAAWIRADEFSSNTLVGHSNGEHKIQFSNSTTVQFNISNQGNEDITVSGLSTNTWHHFVVTRDEGTGETKIYVDGVLVGSKTFDAGANFVINRIGIKNDSPFDGDLRDVRIYDNFLMSDEQVASYYSNTLPITPTHMYKFDDSIQGTSTTTAVDSGTGTTRNGSLDSFVTTTGNAGGGGGSGWQNGTLDLDGTLTIAANGTLSAPRGTLEVGQESTSGTPNLEIDFNGTFIHNNGLFQLVGYEQKIYFGGATFYNLESGKVDWNRKYVREAFTVANALTVTKGFFSFDANINNYTATFSAGATINVTDIGSAGIDFISNTSNAVTVQGDTVSPVAITGKTWDFDLGGSGSTVKLSNIDYDPDVVTGGNGVTIQLTGDCEFDAVTVSSGDTLQISDGTNGQRATFGGGLWVRSGGILTDDGDSSLIHITGTSTLRSYAGDSSTQWAFGHHDTDPSITLGNTDMIISGGAASIKMPSTANDFARTVLVSASGAQKIDSGVGFCPQNLIAGSEVNTHSSNNNKIDTTNLTIPTGGTLTANASTLTVAGDFTTSGGLLGASCLSLDRSNTEYVEVADHADLDFPFNRNKLTAECWFKTSRSDDYQYLFDRRNGQDIFYLVIADNTDTMQGRVFTSGTTTNLVGATVITDGKWHHAALVYNGSTGEHSIYIDGKLDAQETGSGAIYSGTIPLRFGTRYNDIYFMDGEIDEIRLFAAAKTAAQIRDDMFTAEGTNLTHFNSAADASTDGLIGRWGCNEGTGSALSCSNSNLNGVIYDYNGGSPAAYTDAWAGAGTFTIGTSTLTMTGTSKKINTKGNTGVYNLTISGTTSLTELTGGYSFSVNNNLTVDASKTLSSTASEILKITNGASATVTLNNTSGLANLFTLRPSHSSGTLSLPELTTKKLLLDTSGGTTQATGNHTYTTELEVGSGTTFNANTNTIAAKGVDVNSGTLDLRNSTLNFSVTNSGDFFEMDGSSTLLTGNTAITGHSSATKTPAILLSSGGFEVVGDVKFLAMSADADLTVIGAVIDCDTSESGANIRQFFHTLDTQQLLDADEAGDDDLRLTKPALDNALELMTK
jgi:hypothetical protein